MYNSIRFQLAKALFIITFLAGPAFGFAATYTWNAPSGGDWHNPANWTPNGVPGSADDAVINIFTVQLNSSASVRNLDLGATITGTGTLEVTGGINWGLSAISGGLTLRVSNAESVNFVSNGDLHVHTNSVIENFGNIEVGGTAGDIVVHPGGRVRNINGATLKFTTRVGVEADSNSGGLMENQAGAVIVKRGTSTTTEFRSISFTNRGVIRVESGTLRFSGNTVSSGSIVTHTNATAEYRGHQIIETGSQLTGNRHRFLLGSTNDFGGLIRGEHLEFEGGAFGGTFTNIGRIVWTGGDMNRGGRLTIPAGSALETWVDRFPSAGPTFGFENHGLVSVDGNHGVSRGLSLISGSWLNNHPGARLELRSGASLDNGSQTTDVAVTNYSGATISKSSGQGVSRFLWQGVFVNDGRFECLSGEIELRLFSDNTGVFHAETNAAIYFNGSHAFLNGSRFTGEGLNAITWNADLIGEIHSENLHLRGQQYFGSFTNRGHVIWSTGTFTGNVSILNPPASRLELRGGFVVPGITGGSLAMGSGPTNTVAIVNHGSINSSGGRVHLSVSGNGGIENLPGSSMLVETDLDLTGGSLTNRSGAVLSKNGGTGTSRWNLDQPLSNQGEFRLASGVIVLSADLNLSPESALKFVLSEAAYNATPIGLVMSTNSASLRGSLEVSFSGTNAPAIGTDYTALIMGSTIGNFDRFRHSHFNGHRFFRTRFDTVGQETHGIFRIADGMPRIDSPPVRTVSNVEFRFSGNAGRTYVIESATSLAAGGNWQPMSTNLLSQTELLVSTPIPGGNAEKFYRVRLVE